MERNGPSRRGVPLDLVIRDKVGEAGEVIRVWLDETGIHFHSEGSRTEGHLPWTVAIAMSLLPPDAPRAGLVIEAA
ncbi:MAG TPA: hypothetical protein VMR50_17500 [Myxococcota bacterium]|nr:hypothetical protein [Myxococcota bacterium]